MRRLLTCLAALMVAAASCAARSQDPLESGFKHPPREARLRCYWWWLNGNVTKQSITRDLEGMASHGFGGALLVDAGGAAQQGNQPVPKGPEFGSPAWRELFRYALAEAHRLGLELSFNIQSGWNLGGPSVKPEQSAKLATWSRTYVHGPVSLNQTLDPPPSKESFYRDVFVLAYPLHHGAGANPRPVRDLAVKASLKEAGFSMPDTVPLLNDIPPQPGEQDADVTEVRDISQAMNATGNLKWNVPPGDWEILRFGYTSSASRVSTSSGDWQGLVIDYLDHTALDRYWSDVMLPLLDDAKPYLGNTLRYLVTDSWELNGVNWTQRFAEEFRRRRGYDIRPYLPVLAGRIIQDRETTNRFLNDLRRTVGDLVADEHYAEFAALARKSKLGIHPESGGPHGAPIDALQCLGRGAFPQTEFWAKSPEHRVKDQDRFFIKEAASAAHIYGKTLVAGEGFTTIGTHWNESLASNLKPTFDRALCEGLNRHIWHQFTSSPEETGIPGQEYFAGTHFNPKVTWWDDSIPFLTYLNRGQFLMQQGVFVADALYYYGDHVPNFVRLKSDDPAKVLPGYDYDVTNEEVLLTRLQVKGNILTLPGGMHYSILVLPDLPNISLNAIRKLRDLVQQGATVVGSRPKQTTGLSGSTGDQEVERIAAELWGPCDEKAIREHSFGKGQVLCAGTGRQALLKKGILPDFEADRDGEALDYIHRSAPEAELYFVSNQSERVIQVNASFRVTGKTAELWNPVTGEMHTPDSSTKIDVSGGRTKLPIKLPPYGSIFVVFRNAARPSEPVFQSSGAVTKVEGPWHVRFASPAATPGERDFPELTSWTASQDDLVKYFSGRATYSKDIEIPAAMLTDTSRLTLDLGSVGEIAGISLNGKPLGSVWTYPFAVDITRFAKPGPNHLEIQVTNLWINRLKGDAQLPLDRRTTRTNITHLPAGPLMPSGLLGPVTLRSEIRSQ